MQHEDQLILRVDMPGTIETGAANFLESEALRRLGRQSLENGFHAWLSDFVAPLGRNSITECWIMCSIERPSATVLWPYGGMAEPTEGETMAGPPGRVAPLPVQPITDRKSRRRRETL